MSSKIKFFSHLCESLKSFVFLQLHKLRTARKISQQHNFDKTIIATLNGRKIPKFKQFKKLPQTLSAKEIFIIKILASIVLACLIILVYFNYYTKLIAIPANGGELNEGLIGSPLFINPILAQSHVDPELDISRLVFSGLLKYNTKLELTPDLAEKYETSTDQKTYTFYLKQNAKWHDGEKLTASDIVFTIQSIQDPDFKSPLYRSFLGVTAEKIDDYTIKFTLQEPYAAFVNLLTVGIIPQHLWYDTPAINATLAQYNQKPIGSGPYKFKSLIKDKSGLLKSYVIEKNKDYYGQIPYINKINFKFYPDYETAVNALINKEVQSLGFLPKEQLKKFNNKWDLNLFNFSLSQYTAIFFNDRNNDLLKDTKIKEALSYAVNKDRLIEEVLQNQGQKIDGPILPGFLGYSADLQKFAYDPRKAVEILTGAGWQLDGEIFKKDNKELKIVLTTVSQPDYLKTAELIKDYWTSIGVNVEVKPVAKDILEKEIINPRNYEALLYGEIIGYDPDLFPFWHSSQKDHPGVNLSNYVNRQVDQLLEEARLTTDTQVRAQKYAEFQKLLVSDIPAIFLYMPTYSYPITKKIKGIELSRITNPYDRFIGVENWYLKTKKQFFK